MTEAGARGAAGLIFAVIGLVLLVVGRKKVPRPSDRERKAAAEAVREIAHRRFNSLGMADDILGLGWVLISYAGRAYRESE
jgi:hypothetical protein